MFYVYEWYKVYNGEIIYVGKGCKNRYKVRKHNKKFNEIIRNCNCESRIVKEFENEEDAFLYEFERINEMKKVGQCVCNIIDGGTGGSVSSWNDEKRKYYSEHNVMKSEKSRERMRLNNPMKDEKVKARHRKPQCISIIIDGKKYESIKQVRDKYGSSYQSIHRWCDIGVNPFGEKCKYEGSEQINFDGDDYYNHKTREVIYDGKKYKSIKSLADEKGLTLSPVWLWLQNGYDRNGIPCRYADDTNEYIFKPSKSKHPITVDGVEYESIRVAEDKLGLNHGYLSLILRGRIKHPKYDCKYLKRKAQ